jgi:hypothetical protein
MSSTTSGTGNSGSSGGAGTVTTPGGKNNLKSAFEKHKVLHMRGKFLRPRSLCYGARLTFSNPHLQTVFAAYCSPHIQTFSMPGCGPSTDVSGGVAENDTMTFQSVHAADMKFIQIESNGEVHLGYKSHSMFNKSWYEMIHPQDTNEARTKHLLLMESYEIGDMTSSQSACVRVQTSSGQFVWLQVVMHLYGGGSCGGPVAVGSGGSQPTIVCTNQVIDEQAAAYLRRHQADMERQQAEQQIKMQQQQQQFAYESLPSTPIVYSQPELNSLPVPVVASSAAISSSEVNERLKKKLKRQQKSTTTTTSGSRPAKIVRKTEAAVDEDVKVENLLASLLSMPSPPLQHYDYDIPTVVECAEAYSPPPPPSSGHDLPFLTPSSSPDSCAACDHGQFHHQLGQSTDCLDDLEHVFLGSDGTSAGASSTGTYFGYGASPRQDDGDSRSFFPKKEFVGLPLPVLDPNCVASLLDQPSSAPYNHLPQQQQQQQRVAASRAPVAACDVTYRLQMSGGHVTVADVRPQQPAQVAVSQEEQMVEAAIDHWQQQMQQQSVTVTGPTLAGPWDVGRACDDVYDVMACNGGTEVPPMLAEQQDALMCYDDGDMDAETIMMMMSGCHPSICELTPADCNMMMMIQPPIFGY